MRRKRLAILIGIALAIVLATVAVAFSFTTTTTTQPVAPAASSQSERAATRAEATSLAASTRAAVAAVAKANGKAAPSSLATSNAEVEAAAAIPSQARAAVSLITPSGRKYEFQADPSSGEILVYRDVAAYKAVTAAGPDSSGIVSEATAMSRIESLFPGRGQQLRLARNGVVKKAARPTEFLYRRVLDGVETDDFVIVDLDGSGDVVRYAQNWTIDPGRVKSALSAALPREQVLEKCATEGHVDASTLTATLVYRRRLLHPEPDLGRAQEQFIEGLFYEVEGPWSAYVDAGTGDVVERITWD